MEKNSFSIIKIKNYLNENFWTIFLVIQIVFLSITFHNHALNIDEAWFAEESYFMKENGYSTSNFFYGFLRSDERVVVQHKLFVMLEASVFKIFGFGMTQMRIIPIISTLLLIVISIIFIRKFDIFNKSYIPKYVVVLLSIPQVYYFSITARPESLLTLMGFCSFYFLYKYFSAGDKKLWVILSGLFAGLSMLSHLNGIIFVASGFVFLLLKRRYLMSILFTVFAIIAFSPYLIEIYTYFDIFKLQINNPFISSKTNFSILTPLINFSKEHQRLFRKPEIIFISVLFLFNLIVNFKKLYREDKHLIIYTLILMIILGLLIEDKQTKYSHYLSPFWVLIIIKSFVIGFRTNVQKNIAVSLLVIFLSFSVYYSINLLLERDNIIERNNLILENIPNGKSLVGPQSLIFNGILSHRIISNYLLRFETNNSLNVKNLYNFLVEKKAEYVVFEYKYLDDKDRLNNMNSFDEYFVNVIKNNDFWIIKVKK